MIPSTCTETARGRLVLLFKPQNHVPKIAESVKVSLRRVDPRELLL